MNATVHLQLRAGDSNNPRRTGYSNVGQSVAGRREIRCILAHRSRDSFELTRARSGATKNAELQLLRAPVNLGSSPFATPDRAPFLGQHTEEVLRERLGYSAE